MKLRNFIFAVLASLAFMTGCQPAQTEDLGVPALTIDVEELVFAESADSQNITLNATREWIVDYDADWIAVSPEAGQASSQDQVVTISVLDNAGMDRTADLKFTIGMKSRYVTVSQKGPGGSADALIVYYNDYDKEEATKTFGSGESWPYLDQFDGWKNETGTGAAGVEYTYSGMSARANSTSNSNYSDYEGSGKNNMFFGKSAYLATNNIALGGATSFTLTFGTEKYSQDNGSVFTKSEFHIFLSNDGAKWVELTDYSFAGEGTEGRWNLATAHFSVPAGTESLSICTQVDVASSYRMDDLRLEISEGGQTVDFNQGVEMDFTAGGDNGGQVTPPSDITDVTVAEFNEKSVSTSDWYRLTGTVGGPVNTTYGNFDLIDETGSVYVYGIDNWSEFSSQVAEGGTVTVVGNRGDYNGKIEVLNGYIESYVPGEGGEGGGDAGQTGAPETLVQATVAEFLAAAEDDTWYKLTGEIISIASETYGNFTIKDETGEVYVYGMTNGWVGSNDKSFSEIGLNVGDIVTFGTLRASYNGSPQGGGSAYPAYYISHVEGETPEVTPTEGKYVLVSEEQSDWTGKYLIVFGTSAHSSLTSKDLNATVKDLEIVNGEIAADTAVDAAAIDVTAAGDAYSVMLPGGKYFGMQKNGCKNFDEPFAVSFEYTAEGVKMSGYVESEGNTFILYHNSNNGDYYRCYVDKNGMAGYALPQLYKYIAE